MVSYREAGRARGITAPNIVKPETAHPAFDKACWLLGMEVRTVPVDPSNTLADVPAMARAIDGNTVALIASAGNYPYGTVDPVAELGALAQAHGVGLHVDGCLGGFILPFGEMLGIDIPVFDFRVPGVTTISADTHKYGYSVKGTSLLLFRDRALRNVQYFYNTDWSGGKYCSPGIDGSRSVGLLAATWASMVALGKEGYLERARHIFDTSFAMQDAVRSHPELRLMGRPTFCFSFTSNEFDVYHVNDFMRTCGWRLNGQQHPGALHMAVTGPQTQPGVVEEFALDLDAAVAYANEHRGQTARSSGVYAGVDLEGQQAWDSKVRSAMEMMMDRFLDVPGEYAR
jgi:glutamate/tyrosine decarboxylase-like PLP-dependent enzyme